MAELIKATDNLNEGRLKLNNAITDSEKALNTANVAKATADLSKAESESTQTQLDTIVIEGDSSVEAAQARVDSKGVPHTTLKSRIDNFEVSTAQQLAKTEQDLTAQLLQTVSLAPGKGGIGYAGVIRRDNTGWFYVDDANHENINFTTVSENTATHDIRIEYKKGTKVGSLVAVPDETFAKFGIVMGASVGDFFSLIRSYAPLDGYLTVNPSSVSVSVNELFTGTLTATQSADKTKITVDYDGGTSGFQKVLAGAVSSNNPPHTGMEYRTRRAADGQVEIRAYSPFYAMVYFNGTEWLIQTSCVAGISASWDTVTNELVITHDSLYNAGFRFHDVATELRKPLSGGLIHRRVSSVNYNTIRVEFYDQAGVKITTPNTNMRMWVSKPGMLVPHEITNGAQIYFDLGYAVVRPSKMNIVGSNIWLLGIHNK